MGRKRGVVFLLEEACEVPWGADLNVEKLSGRLLSESLGSEENHGLTADVHSEGFTGGRVQPLSWMVSDHESNLAVTVIKPV